MGGRRRRMIGAIGVVVFCGAAGLGAVRLAVAEPQRGGEAEGVESVDPRLTAILETHEAGVERLETRLRAAKAKLLAETVGSLKALQDEHCRAARLDEALAVREQLRRLERQAGVEGAAAVLPVVTAPPGPDSFAGLPTEVGATHLFTVTGAPRGIAWGTDVYTIDSSLAAAAVHAGALASGETAVVRVTIVDSPAEHVGTVRHGITTHRWPRYRMSFRVERFGAASPAAVPPTPIAVPALPPPPDLPAIPLTPARPVSPYDGPSPAPPTAALIPAEAEQKPAEAEATPAEAEPAPRAPVDRSPPRRPFD